MRRVILCALLVVATGILLLTGCSPDTIAGGTSTSENGRITGKVVTAEGSAAEKVEVVLLPADFDPVTGSADLQLDTTDEAGAYSFSSVAPGAYAVTGVHLVQRTRMLASGILVNDDTVSGVQDTLRTPGAIEIGLNNDSTKATGHLYIPGTMVGVQLSGNTATVTLDSVPAGTVPFVAYAPDDSSDLEVVRYNITVQPEVTTGVYRTRWKYSRRLRLNTTASGAGTRQTVYRFSVLLRLSEHNFNFNQALEDGSDLLITGSDNTALPLQIERWDVITGRAEVWVRCDSIPGDDSTTSLIMYWGNPDASAPSNEEIVFDTAAGFAAVWHLGESADTLYDATENRNSGVRSGDMIPSEGMIGAGQLFGTAVGYADMGNVLNTGSGDFTVSAWIKRADTLLQTVIAKSYGDTPTQDYGWALTLGVSGQVHFFTATGGSAWGEDGAFDIWSVVDQPVFDTAWHHIAVAIDRGGNDGCRVYIDGVDVTMGANGDITSVGSITTTAPLRIGAESDGDAPWAGMIDECVIATTIRSADWIRLCFSNQGPQDRLVVFE